MATRFIEGSLVASGSTVCVPPPHSTAPQARWPRALGPQKRDQVDLCSCLAGRRLRSRPGDKVPRQEDVMFKWLVGTTLLALSIVGCATAPAGPEIAYLNKCGSFFCDPYLPPAGQNQLVAGRITVTIDKVAVGGNKTDFLFDVTVRNSGAEEIAFDPASIEILVPDTGLTYYHISKDRNLVNVPMGLNLITPIRLG